MSSNGSNNFSKSRPGRPRALDEYKRREICAVIHMGCSLEAAARYVGCSASTVRREANRNPEFNDALRRSGCSAQLMPLQAMREFAKKYWRAAAWLLERMDPQRFGKLNIRYVDVEQFQAILETTGNVLRDEIHDPADLQRVLEKLHEICKLADQEALANLQGPFAKPPKRSRQSSHFQYPPEHSSLEKYEPSINSQQ
jgi:hypothetical protein